MDAIRLALIDFNRVEPAQVPLHRRRMELILRVPALLAHSTLRFTAWRDVVAEFVADRTGRRPEELAPQAIAHAVLGVSVAAYEHWLDHPAADLGTLLDDAMRQLGAGRAPPGERRPLSRHDPERRRVSRSPRGLRRRRGAERVVAERAGHRGWGGGVGCEWGVR